MIFGAYFPNTKIGIVICHGIVNSIRDKEQYAEMILEAEKEALKYLRNAEFSSNEVIKSMERGISKV